MQTGAEFVCEDDGALGPTRNHVRAWLELADQNSEWSVTIEDDAIPAGGADFRRQLGLALQHSPRPITSLYLGTGRPPQFKDRIETAVAKAEANDAAFILASEMFHAVAIAVRTEFVSEMLSHIRLRSYLPIDQAVGNWARRKWRNTLKHPIAYTVPSLVDHCDGPSLVKHPDGAARIEPRKAYHVGVRASWDNANVVTM